MGIFNIFARMTLDSSQFEAGSKRVESMAAALGKRIGGYFAAGAVGYGLLNFARTIVDTADNIQDLSEQLQITTDEVQELQRVARHAGVDMNKYADALLKVKRLRLEALQGDSGARGTLSALGVNEQTDPLQILRAVGNATTPSAILASYDLLGARAGRIKESLKEIGGDGGLEIISPAAVFGLAKAKSYMEDIWAAVKGISAEPLGRQALMGYAALQFLRIPGQSSPLSQPGLPLPARYEIGQDEGIERNMARLGEEFRARNQRIREAREGYNDPLSFGAFRSSTANQRAEIGGFFLGADQTARLDIERQQLQAQKMMADRIDRIEKQVAKITEGA